MATPKDWLAYEAATELLNPKNVKSESVIDIGSRYPLFTKMVLTDGTQSLIHILKALPKATAKMIEAGLRGAKQPAKEAPADAEKKKPGRPAAKPKAAEKEAEEEEDENPYAGKSAKELYTMCKERGLKVKTKQPASEYAKLLMEDDQDAQDPADPEDDDWEEEEEEKEEKKAAPKKKPGRPAKKKEPEPEEEEDDDDWEI